MKFAYKIGALAALVLVVIVVALTWLQVSQARSTLTAQAVAAAQQTSQVLTTQIATWLNNKATLIDAVATDINRQNNTDYIFQQVNRPRLKQEFVLLYGGLEGGNGAMVVDDPTWRPAADYDARKRPWYQLAKNNDSVTFTSPYTDASSGDLLITVVKKLQQHGQFVGVLGGDIALTSIKQALNTIDFSGAGYAFLLDNSGTIVAHPQSQWDGKTLQEWLGQALNPKTATSPYALAINGQDSWIIFTALQDVPGVDWSVGVVLNKNKLMASSNAQLRMSLLLAVVALMVGVLLVVVVLTHQLQPLATLREALINIHHGDGNLTKRLALKRQDEFGEVADAFDGFVGNLQHLIQQVKDSAVQLQSTIEASVRLSAGSRQDTQAQMQELEQLATAMNEMSATASQVAQYTQDAASAAQQAHGQAQQGISVMAKSTQAVGDLAANLDETMQAVNELNAYSSNIESILSVIVNIAEQTNLLALNAAIEAARAGEQGRGFAVVADEVRTLASRTQGSTKEIEDMIAKLQQGAQHTATMMQQSQTLAQQTVAGAEEANQALQSIGEAINMINDMNSQIATAAEQQSATGEEINKNTTNIRDLGRSIEHHASEQMTQAGDMQVQIDGQNALLGRFTT